MALTVVALVEDLIFLTKIQETAKALGVTVVTAEAQCGSAAIAEAQPQAIFLDLNSRRVPAVACIRALKADPATRGVRIIGFASHVQGELIAACRAAGCDTVLARSAFAQQLPNTLRGLATPAEKG